MRFAVGAIKIIASAFAAFVAVVLAYAGARHFIGAHTHLVYQIAFIPLAFLFWNIVDDVEIRMNNRRVLEEDQRRFNRA